MKTFYPAVLMLGLFGAPAFAQATCEPGETVIKFSHVVAAEGHPKGEMATALAARVNREMDGTACMLVFPMSELYDDNDVMEAILLGDVHLAAPSVSKLENYTFQYRVFDLPFLFDDMDAVQRFVGGPMGQDLLDAMSDYGFAGLGYLFNGLKQFSASRPLLVPGDAEGLTFRVQASDVATSMVEALGARARQLPFEEVRAALQKGLVDGQENTWSNIYTAGFYEFQEEVTATNHQLLVYLVVTSKEWLDSLDNDVRLQFLSILGEVIEAANMRADGINQASRQRIVEAGGTVRELTGDQRRQWRSVMAPVWDEYETMIGVDLIDAAIAAND